MSPTRSTLSLVVAAVALCGTHSTAVAGEILEVPIELRHSGANYDDPCFWGDPVDPHYALGCITSKNTKQVECFDLATNEFVGAATGFTGEANNCDVDRVRNEMVSTDNFEQLVLVHKMPSLELLRTLPVPEASDLAGICVARDGERSLLFVTDEDNAEVIALDSESGEVRWRWPHGMVDIECIACDDEWERVILCDDEGGINACQAFAYDGRKKGEPFGGEALGIDPEGIAIYRCPERTGYIVVADPEEAEFEVFRRDDFAHVCTFTLKAKSDITDDTDGIAFLQSLGYPEGLFGACDDCSSEWQDELDVVPWAEIAAACGIPVCPPSAAKPAAAPPPAAAPSGGPPR